MSDALIDKMVARAKTRAEAQTVDGVDRSPALEEHINQLCRSRLTGTEGEALMLYLRSITTNRILLPSASDSELRFMEGMRNVVAILDARRQSKPKDAE